MDDSHLITALEFYLRHNLRLLRIRPDPSAQLPDWAEEVLWDYAQRAAERLERLQQLAARQMEPAPARRRRQQRF